MHKFLLAFVLLFTTVIASAQVSEKDLIICNKIRSESKRLDCLKEVVYGQATTQKAFDPQAEDGPLTLEKATLICKDWMDMLQSLKTEPAINESKSNEEFMVLQWKDDEGHPSTSCSVDKKTKDFFSGEYSGYTFTKQERQGPREIAKKAAKASEKMKRGDYSDFISNAKFNLTKNFKDPSSVQYRNLFISRNENAVLCGEVNGRNSYGGYEGFRRFYSSENQFLASVEGDKGSGSFEDTFTRLCSTKTIEIQTQ